MSDLIETRLLTERSSLARLDVWPWVLGHGAVHARAWAAFGAGERETAAQWLALAGVLLLVHGLAVIAQQWSVEWKCACGFARATTLAKATHVLARPPRSDGLPEISVLSQASGGARSDDAVAKAAAAEAAAPLQVVHAARAVFLFQNAQYESHDGVTFSPRGCVPLLLFFPSLSRARSPPFEMRTPVTGGLMMS
jgi:hypothetical protein